ncbi:MULTISPECIES: transcriptional regulator FtrA [unclassified Rhizobium]|uniref:transcriptional regulator FtrA n=1 Tax=unclassified Rhizobium TaxID=2613769 RepID=UPI0017839961|nr:MULTISPECIES: transcriptional regulator FtrA [unclassified Rhizobium]MBD8685612.1 transcriptional regulator FtrA [Rhizobium sp. CFBP 13644]MBD8690715.1 transcriptional regulator FtrA [Rhizobium sp. CFBP 13717]
MPKHLTPPSLNRLVVALAYDGLCTFEFGVAVEIFGLARPEMGDDWYRFAVAGIDDGEMRATGGVRFLVDGGLELIEQAGTIIVPGWRGIHEPVPEALCVALRKAHENGTRLLSLCSGVFVLAAAGLLDGRQATTHWRYTDALKAQFGEIEVLPDVLYVDGGTVLTAAGSAAGIDLCLHLVRRDFGSKAANMVARRLVVVPHRDGGQAQFIDKPVPETHEKARLGPLLDAVQADLCQDYTVAKLAQMAGMSSRTLLRRFEAATGMTPARWLLLQRLSKAKDLLEGSKMGIEDVAQTSGLGSAANLRHHFRQQFSITPVAYRARFGTKSLTPLEA